MRVRRVVALASVLLGAAIAPASAAWTDSSEADGSTLSLLTLTAPTLGCAQSGALLASATVSWTPSSDPTALTYSAQLLSPSSVLTITSNSVTVSPGLLDGLLGGLLGSSVTVRVTATLPGTNFTVSSDRVLYYKLVLAVPTVSCTP